VATFPKDFLWGAATAAYQVEGAANIDGRGPSIWDTFSHAPGNTLNGDTGDVACDHYHRYPEDIALMKTIGLQGYRFSFSWSRLFPNGDLVKNQKGFDFYDKLINEIESAGITPLSTLYHWDLPQTLQDKGGWVNRETVDRFGEYAAAVAQHFGDRIKNIAPINEPWCVAWLGHGLGVHAPGHKDRKEVWAAAHHTVIAHATAMNSMRAVRSDIKIGPVINQANYPADDPSDPYLSHASDLMDAMQNRWWMDAFMRGSYPQVLLDEFGDEILPVIKDGDMELARTKNDWLGINFYFDTRIGKADVANPVQFDPSTVLGLTIDSTPKGELTDMGWPLTPHGLKNLMVRWHKEYGSALPDIYITENGVAYPDGPDANGEIKDLRRINYLRTHLAALSEAIAEGAPVKGYFQWSLLDNFEWSLGYAKRFGIVHVDYATQERRLKDSAKWYSEVIKSNGANI